MSIIQFFEGLKHDHAKEIDEINEFQKLLDDLDKPQPQIISIRVTTNT